MSLSGPINPYGFVHFNWHMFCGQPNLADAATFMPMYWKKRFHEVMYDLASDERTGRPKEIQRE